MNEQSKDVAAKSVVVNSTFPSFAKYSLTQIDGIRSRRAKADREATKFPVNVPHPTWRDIDHLLAVIDLQSGQGDPLSQPPLVKRMAQSVQRAESVLRDWIDTTGAVLKDGSYDYELQGIVKDAVSCGVQAGLGIYKPLDCEEGDGSDEASADRDR